MTKKDSKVEGFLTIRKRILIIAIFATLVPSLLLGWISYYQTHKVLQAKAVQELEAGLERTSRGLDAWFKEKFYDLHVFAGSFVLKENLTHHLQQSTAGSSDAVASEQMAGSQIREFLQLVQDQSPDYHRLLVLEKSGSVVAQFPHLEAPPGFGSDWSSRIKEGLVRILDQRSGREARIPYLSLGVPILSSTASDPGLLAADIPLSKLNEVIEFSTDTESEMLLVGNGGEIVLSSLLWKYPEARGDSIGHRQDGTETAMSLARYSNYRGVDVVSRSLRLSQVPWRLVIEKPYQSVFSEVDKLRDIALLLTLILLAGFGLLAYMVSQSILLPLSRLTQAAAAVAEGNLNVCLETDNQDELGFTMAVFNDMVKHLRVSKENLERISITDSLTGLYNRKYLMDSLALQFSRYQRRGSRFSILMLDVDHFKQINDRWGHLAGDAALRQIGIIFRSVLRNIDIAGRYGGEEFLIILEQVGERQALETAERVRSVIEKSELLYDGLVIRFSVSVGVATVAESSEDTPTSLIQRADRSLYLAKQRGRNQVVAADTDTRRGNITKLLPV